MSLAREKYLKRKRELLENINLIDIGEKISNTGKNEGNSKSDNIKKESRSRDFIKNDNRTRESFKKNDRGEYIDNDRKHLKSNNYNMLSSYNNKDIKNENRDLRKSPYDHRKLNNKNEQDILSNKTKRSSTNLQYNNDYAFVNKENNVLINNSSKMVNSTNNINEYLKDLNNIDINDSLILLFYVCKLLLDMCSKVNMNQSSMNTSVTSVEMLRDMKSKNRKNIKLFKINILNNILIYLSDENVNTLTQGNPNYKDNNFEKRHEEIRIDEKCIDIEHVGINIVIKVIYINNIKKLIFKYLYLINNNFKHDGVGNINMYDGRLNKNEEQNYFTTPLMEHKNINFMNNNNNNNMHMNNYHYNNYNVNFNPYNCGVVQESEKKNVGNVNNKVVLQKNYSNEYEMKYKEENKNNKINYLENLLNEPTAKEKKIKEEKTNILSIIEAPTVIEEMRIKKFQKKDDSVKIICPYLTKKVCQKHNKECNKVHFKKIISEHTDVSLGDCSYLDTCRHIETCKFVHYAVDKDDQQMNMNTQENLSQSKLSFSSNIKENVYGPQWIRCDLRNFDLSIFNKYVSVVMADPPWDIHMDLPYGTMTDNEMKLLPVQLIQDEGMIFLWVTGRAMELARECLQIWGYKRVEEILWVKTNHLQRIIRTGRTGHWLNHSKEHCLVGIKGNPIINRNIDCNVIVSEVRETSRKPDEIYSLIERLCPQNLKIELFGRPHNCRSNWITLGNQLNGVVLHHPQIKERYNKVATQFNLPLCEK
ncbi:hypothetical protein PFAG_01839 [Plasmodium falciparum Santa Lucia]|uniref:mRNA (N6-adenosine)-methyltransferase n=3 Tax=Plasmodium falciparum TaxID=5833 RepID=A0A024VU67_PLAFA|nr:hypothetical protein PFFCH_01208 [Plasmodium falciparum FCH/4]ETW43642.1 hypothetical protein PFNF135_02002 [Plasmodium falciparum NF135/5.C10]EUT87938.1 hypothetical protein PFAG_01839 [Plasmodium falciparum Santa Lucia]